MTRIARARMMLVSLSALAAAGCGSGSDAPGGNAAAAKAETATAEVAAIDTCALVTKEEVAAVLGEPILATKADGDSCTYETEDKDASSVTLTAKRGGAAEEMETQKATAKFLGNMGGQMAGKEGAQGDVGKMLASGGAGTVGDESLFDANQQIHVRKGDVYIAVQPPFTRSRLKGGNPLLSRDEKRAMVSAIAQKALAKL